MLPAGRVRAMGADAADTQRFVHVLALWCTTGAATSRRWLPLISLL
jgi:hypothetical protein